MKHLYTALLTIALLPNLSFAQCPYTMKTATAQTAVAWASNGMSAASFLGAVCTTAKIGSPAPIGCVWLVGSNNHQFGAYWNNQTDRVAAGQTGGCSFMCQGGGTMASLSPSCFVRASDALPVELMEFGIVED